MSIPQILEILDRAHDGPICKLRDWDSKLVPSIAKEKVDAYGLRDTCDPENPVNSDDRLADEFFEAGFDLAAELGLYCVDTERIIGVTEPKLKDSLRAAPSQFSVGSGHDRVSLESRKPEDGRPPRFCSPLGIAVSEEMWIPLMQGIAEQRNEVDMIQGGSLITVFGRDARSGTPYETLAGRVQAQMHSEAMWRAGRPGIGTVAVISSVTLYGQVGGFGVPGGFDAKTNTALVLSPAELKTNYTSLNKVVHAVNCGGKIHAGTASFIGGFAGAVEPTIVVSIAANLLYRMLHLGSVAGGSIYDLRYNANSGREAMWAISVKEQAVSRFGHLITNSVVTQTAGPCTEMLLYEIAVGMMNIACSGASMSVGPRSGGGKYTDHITPLECKFAGEILHSSAGMKRQEVNEIVKQLIPRYEADLRTPPKGKSFGECYRVDTLKPSEEWKEIYMKARKEIVDLGVPLDS